MDNGGSSLDLRKRMVLYDIGRQGVTDENVLDAFLRVPRERFMPPGLALREVYGDHPYPIGFGQTISQPFIVAYMIQMLGCGNGDRVLEIGTGSGYQTAILAAMGIEVISIELIPQLAARARKAVMDLLPEANVRFIVADGYHGWEPGSPFQGIIVSAAPREVPRRLEMQLSPDGGRMVIPAGSWSQQLMLIIRDDDELSVRNSLPVRFVPLVRPDATRPRKAES
jgi:protein-L-isoaspartate(D-aspartate) O-methyltransferase